MKVFTKKEKVALKDLKALDKFQTLSQEELQNTIGGDKRYPVKGFLRRLFSGR